MNLPFIFNVGHNREFHVSTSNHGNKWYGFTLHGKNTTLIVKLSMRKKVVIEIRDVDDKLLNSVKWDFKY